MAATTILDDALARAQADLDKPVLSKDLELVVGMIVDHRTNRAVCRLVMSCALAKADNPLLDPLKPYTEIGSSDSFSGRTYDERYLGPFILKHELPCNSTTAFLTPAFRNRSSAFKIGENLAGNDPSLYNAGIALLDKMAKGSLPATDLLQEILRQLLIRKKNERDKIAAALAELAKGKPERSPLSSSAVCLLIKQHLQQPRSSRLPVLVVKAVYDSISDLTLESSKDLLHHNAADRQTAALGDLEVVANRELDRVLTAYEMKDRAVTRTDVEEALRKVVAKGIDNYIFITTAPIDRDVLAYAENQYALIGVEVTILDCVGFTNHFLHFFHRRREQFLDRYQELVLAEPDSAVGAALKEVWLSLRKAAEVPPPPSP